MAAANPVHGIAREHEFLTIATLIAWLEKKTEPMREEIAREQRVEEQLRAREEWQNEPKDPVLMDKCKSWLNRTDPAAQQMTGFKDAAKAESDLRRAETIQGANRAVFARECKQSGINPASGVSPSLLKLLESQNAG